MKYIEAHENDLTTHGYPTRAALVSRLVPLCFLIGNLYVWQQPTAGRIASTAPRLGFSFRLLVYVIALALQLAADCVSQRMPIQRRAR
jgi:hypothetical protein